MWLSRVWCAEHMPLFLLHNDISYHFQQANEPYARGAHVRLGLAREDTAH